MHLRCKVICPFQLAVIILCLSCAFSAVLTAPSACAQTTQSATGSRSRGVRVNLAVGKTLSLPLPAREGFQVTGDDGVLSWSEREKTLELTAMRPGRARIEIRDLRGFVLAYNVRIFNPTTTLIGSPAAAPVPAPRVTAAPVAISTDKLAAQGTYQVTGSATGLTVFAVSADAPELFTAMAERAGLSLIVDDAVQTRITINLQNQLPRVAVETIANAYGLSVAEVGGVLMVSEGIPRSPSSYLLSEIEAIRTKYVDAANARNLLPVFLQDYVKVSAEQNAVVLSAPREVLVKFRDDIAEFDIPASQILIDLLLVEITDTDLDQFGLTFSYGTRGRGASSDTGAGSIVLSAITTLPTRFRFDLKALEEKGKARVHANPRIATVSGRRATIFVGRQRYVRTPIEGGRNFIDAGVRLGITPYTGGERQVLVDVDTEVSTLSAPDPNTGLPEKSTRTANTTIRVQDGQTIVIGGLRQQESRDVRTKTPLLGDIPLLGPLLFRSKDSRSTNSELMLFITPRILSDTGHLPADEEAALKNKFLDGDLPALMKQTLPPLQSPPLEVLSDKATQ